MMDAASSAQEQGSNEIETGFTINGHESHRLDSKVYLIEIIAAFRAGVLRPSSALL
jgi:hypothetical protein